MNTTTILIGTACASALLLTGCVGHQNSYSYKDHDAEVTLLTKEQLEQYAVTHYPGNTDLTKDYAARFNEVFPPDPNKKINSFDPVTGAAIASLLAGLVVDTVKTEMEKEAKKYEQQFTAWTEDPNFWEYTVETNKLKITQKYYGFAMSRWSKEAPRGTNATSVPAMRIVVAMKVNKDDPRFLQLTPLFFQTKKAMAKIASGSGKLTSRVRIALEASFVDKGLNMRLNETLGIADWEVSNYDLNETEQFFFRNKDYRAGNPYITGVFASPPISYLDEDLDAKPDVISMHPIPKANTNRATPIRVTVQVTERDETKAAEYIERAAKFLADKKGAIQKAAGEAVGKK